MKSFREWFRSVRARNAATTAFRAKYPNQATCVARLFSADGTGYTVTVYYGYHAPLHGRSWWHICRGSLAASEIQQPSDGLALR